MLVRPRSVIYLFQDLFCGAVKYTGTSTLFRRSRCIARRRVGQEMFEHNDDGSALENFFELLAPHDFFDNINMGVIVHRADGAIVGCNQMGAALLEKTREQMIGRTFEELPWIVEPYGIVPNVDSDAPGFFDSGGLENQRSRVLGVLSPGKSVRWLMTSNFPVVTNGVLQGSMTSLRDVTAQHHKEQSLELMTEVNRLMIQSHGENDFLQNVCDAFVGLGGYRLARFDVAVDDETSSVRNICYAGPEGYILDARITWNDIDTGRGPIGSALRTGVAQVDNDLSREVRAKPWRELMEKFQLRSSVSVPLHLSSGRATMTTYDHHTNAFPESKFRWFQSMVNEIEFAAQHVHSVESTELALDGTMSALSRMTETRDPYTAGHQFSVGALAERIAHDMEIDDTNTRLIRRSGELHDIGKIAVPVEILTRPGRLSAAEFNIMKTHPTVGAEILAKTSLPWPITDVTLQHHERLDGSGYPFGLRASELKMPSRIVAVADVVEAMSQHRPYRVGLGIEKALGEIGRGAGTVYDSDVVASCIRVFENGFHFERTTSSVATSS